MIIERGVVREQRTIAGKVEKGPQALSRCQQLIVLALLNDGILDVAEHLWDGAVALEINGELSNGSPVANPLGRNLDNIIFEDVQPRCLCIENDQVTFFICTQELLQIRPVLMEQIGWGKGDGTQTMHKLSCGSGHSTHFHTLKDLRPRQ